MSMLRKLFQTGFRVGGAMPPGLTARQAARMFISPMARADGTSWRPELQSRLRPFTVRFQQHTVEAWRGGEGPRVLLSHGWGGSAGSMKRLIAPLIDSGHEVIAFDGPGHGRSKIKHTNLREFTTFLLHLEKEFGGFEAAVGHSFGAASLCWPGAKLHVTTGLGHRRILRDEGVAAEALKSLQG